MVQVNNTPLNIRVKFKKVGPLQYISHLDLVRTMHKVIVRAGLPLWYTEGFNPKPKMVFAAPLSIGTESVAEFLDIRLSEKMSEKEIMDRLNANMAPDIRIIEAYYPTTKLTELKWLSYTIKIKTDCADPLLAERCEALLLGESLVISKKSKSGDMVSLDIRPLIRSASCVFDGEHICISAVLSADPSAYLNPEYILKALKENIGILSNPDITSEYYSIMRENAYTADMSEFK